MTLSEKTTYPLRQVDFWIVLPAGLFAFFILLPILDENRQPVEPFSLYGLLILILYLVGCYFFVLIGHRHKLRTKRDSPGTDEVPPGPDHT